jgi:hypothetical protein
MTLDEVTHVKCCARVQPKIRPLGLIPGGEERRAVAMRIAKDEVDVRMAIPGAVIRQQTGFGDASATTPSG